MSSKNLRNSLFLLFFIALCAHAGEVKPKYISSTVRLSKNLDYVRKNPAPDFWAFMPYYVPQQDGAACGIASMTMLLNAARTHHPLSASDALVTQKALVEKIKIDYSKGLTLNKLGEAVKKSIAEYGLKASVEVIHADGTPVKAKQIRELLIKNEKSDRNFVLANFLQATYTGDLEGGGHISPVAAFDLENDRVLIMDVDREYYEPYWISFHTFMNGINTQDKTSGKTRGLVFVELQ